MMLAWANKKVKKSLRVWCYEVMISLRTEMRMKLRCNVYNDIIVKEKCNVQYRAERYSLIIILNSVLFWVMNFLQINYVLRMMFCDVNDAVMIIK